ncbi:response regulator transcription factor [Deinococcus altitudinis]|uniref:response regulator transcription factor n=1 Tax=Deinococcus altitudinis TaxID=468914 RepID=UPI0038926F53
MTGPVVVVTAGDHDNAESTAARLLGAGYAPVVTGSVMQGILLVQETRTALGITELNLPDGDGADVVTRLCKTGIPVMVVSDQKDVTSKVALLESGAADYLVKPFEVRKFLARVASRLRDRRPIEDKWEELAVGELVLDVQRRLVLFRRQEVRLTERERDVLAELMRGPGRVFSHHELLERVWGAETLVINENSNVLAVIVSGIRKKLHAANASGYLVTVRGAGYALRDNKEF